MGEQNEVPNVASQLGQPATVTPRVNHPFDPHTLRTMLAAAAYYARRVARTMRLSDIDRDDVEQEILLVLLERRRFFDPVRGPWSAFTERVARQAAQAVADQIGAERSVHGGSLDQPVGDHSRTTLGELIEADRCIGPDLEQELQLPLMLVNFVSNLPDELALVARLSLAYDDDLAQAQRRSGLSQSEFFRRLREVRYRLLCLGIVRRPFAASAGPASSEKSDP